MSDESKEIQEVNSSRFLNFFAWNSGTKDITNMIFIYQHPAPLPNIYMFSQMKLLVQPKRWKVHSERFERIQVLRLKYNTALP